MPFTDGIEKTDREEVIRKSEEAEKGHDEAYFEREAEKYSDQIAEEMEAVKVDDAGARVGDDVEGALSSNRDGAGVELMDGAKPEEQEREKDQAPLGEQTDLAAFQAVMEDGVKRLAAGNLELVERVIDALRQGLKGVEDAAPKLDEGEAAKLVEATVGLGEETSNLGAQVRSYTQDFHRWRETHRGRNRLLLITGVVALVPALLVLGVLAQHQFGLVALARAPAQDPTNGWKDIVWSAHGREVAICMKEAERTGAAMLCRITAEPK